MRSGFLPTPRPHPHQPQGTRPPLPAPAAPPPPPASPLVGAEVLVQPVLEGLVGGRGGAARLARGSETEQKVGAATRGQQMPAQHRGGLQECCPKGPTAGGKSTGGGGLTPARETGRQRRGPLNLTCRVGGRGRGPGSRVTAASPLGPVSPNTKPPVRETQDAAPGSTCPQRARTPGRWPPPDRTAQEMGRPVEMHAGCHGPGAPDPGWCRTRGRHALLPTGLCGLNFYQRLVLVAPGQGPGEQLPVGGGWQRPGLGRGPVLGR